MTDVLTATTAKTQTGYKVTVKKAGETIKKKTFTVAQTRAAFKFLAKCEEKFAAAGVLIRCKATYA